MKRILLIIIAILFVTSNSFSQEQTTERQLAQPVLMALPAGINGLDPLTTYKKYPDVQAAANAINQVLTERQLEVRDLTQQINNFDRLRAKMKSLNGDMNAMIAASTGADVYLEYTVELINEGPGKKARVSINVKEAATAKMLGASNGVSDAMVTNDISSLAAIAVNNCIDRVMQQIRGYWAEIPKYGKPVIVTISAGKTVLAKVTKSGKKLDRELTKLLKSTTISYNRAMSTQKTMQFNPVYIDYKKYDDVEEYSYVIQDFLEDFGLQFDSEIDGKSIEISVK